jgi:hypothetical protein
MYGWPAVDTIQESEIAGIAVLVVIVAGTPAEAQRMSTRVSAVSVARTTVHHQRRLTYDDVRRSWFTGAPVQIC